VGGGEGKWEVGKLLILLDSGALSGDCSDGSEPRRVVDYVFLFSF
jgi:hypothetical protein